MEEGLAEKVHYAPENLEAAKQTAIESAILLKNNGVLPLKQSVKRVLVTGPMADAAYDQMGTWSFDGDEKHNITPLQAIKDIYGKDVKVIYEPGLLYSRDKSKSNFAKVAAAAKSADVVLAFMGEEAILSGEAHCLVDINLKGAQKEFIELLKKSGTPLVTVVMAGRALTIGEEIENSDALLFSFHPGTMGGPALADIIFGKVSPSGKSPITFPMYVGQIPFYYNRNMSSRPFRGGEKFIDEIPIKASQTSLGNSSYWLDARVEPLVPFGFGLSYTTFEYSNIKLDKESYSKEDVIKVSFTLKNCGKYDAKEVAQVYIRDLVASVTRPIKELKGFDKIFLKAGESKECTIEIPVSRLAFWNIDMQRVVESGDFHLWVGGDSESGNPICFKVI